MSGFLGSPNRGIKIKPRMMRKLNSSREQIHGRRASVLLATRHITFGLTKHFANKNGTSKDVVINTRKENAMMLMMMMMTNSLPTDRSPLIIQSP